MASFLTNRGTFRIMKATFQAEALPSTFYLALVTDSITPTQDTNTLGELAEVPAGNGYTAGGMAVARNSTDFDILTEDDASNRSFAVMSARVWSASSGNLPSSGTGARYAVLTDANTTVSAREVWAVFDLVANRIVSTGQDLTIDNCEIRLDA